MGHESGTPIANAIILTNINRFLNLYTESADDTQLYISFFSADAPDNLSILSSTIDSVYSWFACNRLSGNPSKTEYMLIGNSRQCAKLTSTSLTFCGNNLTPVDSCRNLGVVFDKELSFENISPVFAQPPSIISASFAKFVLR